MKATKHVEDPKSDVALADEPHGEGVKVREAFWVYAPGQRARLWDELYGENLMALGWNNVQEDVSHYRSEEDLAAAIERWYDGEVSSVDVKQLSDFVVRMKPGDKILVKRGIRELVGYGEVKSGYFYDPNREQYRHLRKVEWMKKGKWRLKEGMKALPAKTLTKLKKENRIDELLELLGIEYRPKPGDHGQVGEGSPQSPFTEQSFALLQRLHENPTAAFYNEHGDEFKKLVEIPLQQLFRDVAGRLPPEVADRLETEKRIFSRIRKNDYGRGGAWDFYWGAFYPVGGKRTEDAQLFVSIKSDGLTFGFYVGEYGPDAETRFLEACRRNKTALVKLLKDSLTGGDLIFGDPDRYEELPLLEDKSRAVAWDEWLADPGAYGTRVVRTQKPPRVIETDRTELAEMISETFLRLFPLVLLASHDNPIKEIADLLKEGLDGGQSNPIYTLEQCAQETHFPRSQLERWVRAIERKKQAIFYGPPGTGKTFIAEKLAGHLIGGQDGFREIVQFHPSYAYEDFVQGLRPKAVAEGRLEYSMVPGRFTEFCRAAADVEGRCVLVIDEINRANLSRVLGELMFLLEYRDRSVPLASGGKFRIPDNVRVIGTMNTADRSIALVDHALRRRFAFLALYPDYDVLREFHDTTGFDPKGLIEVLARLNSAINDRHYEVGISFFLHPDIGDKLQDIWEMEIEPYIEELFFDQADTAAGFRWEKVKGEMLQ